MTASSVNLNAIKREFLYALTMQMQQIGSQSLSCGANFISSLNVIMDETQEKKLLSPA